MKILGIIPARGGSKGVPQKNIKNLNGKPLIWYTHQASKASKLLSRTIVSSEDKNILEVCNSLGMDVPFIRPQSLANDETPTIDVIFHALQKIENSREKYDAVCLLQVTTPFRTPQLIDDAIRQFIKKKPDSLISVKRIPTEYSPMWAFKDDGNKLLSPFYNQKFLATRRQDLKSAYYRDGSVYITNSAVIKNMSMYGNTTSYILNENINHVNIDTLSDWEKAKKISSYIDYKNDNE
jgi:CMP-N,N'-diacetyllegionaminic acid synthase